MFGLFENKQAKFWRQETKDTLVQADNNFDNLGRKKIAAGLLTRIFKSIQQLEGLSNQEKKEITFDQIDAVARERRENINDQQFHNPTWMEVALFESWLNMNSGVFGKKLAQEAVMVIYWARSNLSEQEINRIINEVGIDKTKIFGDYN
jgi:uncharacterized protein YpuA (DUF1002 family)